MEICLLNICDDVDLEAAVALGTLQVFDGLDSYQKSQIVKCKFIPETELTEI